MWKMLACFLVVYYALNFEDTFSRKAPCFKRASLFFYTSLPIPFSEKKCEGSAMSACPILFPKTHHQGLHGEFENLHMHLDMFVFPSTPLILFSKPKTKKYI
jgi:hypothetical protein